MTEASSKNIAVMATCLADALRPSVVQATCSLLTHTERDRTAIPPALPKQQTCCGQVLYNAGDRKGARAQALRVMTLFEPFDAIVVPSGSCAGMLKHHYPQLLAEPPHAARARAFAAKVWELTEFLQFHRKTLSKKKTPKQGSQPPQHMQSHAHDKRAVATLHDSCSCLRECSNSIACARSLLAEHGFRLIESAEREVCCGFGGKFSVANSAISTSMADDKLRNLQQSGAEIVASADLGCLLHLSGRARRRQLPLSFFHIAELLAEDQSKSLPIGK